LSLSQIWHQSWLLYLGVEFKRKKSTESEFSKEQVVAFVKRYFAAICSQNYLGVEFEQKNQRKVSFQVSKELPL